MSSGNWNARFRNSLRGFLTRMHSFNARNRSERRARPAVQSWSVDMAERSNSPPRDPPHPGLAHEEFVRGNEPKRRRFHALRVVSRIFRRKSTKRSALSPRSKDEERGQGSSMKSCSTSELLVHHYPDNRESELSGAYSSGLSLSHDSIFAPDSDDGADACDQRQMEGFESGARLFPIPGRQQSLQDELRNKMARRQDSDDDDDAGLPHSPCTSPTTAEVLLQGLGSKSGKFRSSDGSLMSMGSSETDNEDGSASSNPLRLIFDRRLHNADPELDVGATTLLSNQAARHKIAVRPKRKHGVPQQRCLRQVTSGRSLPTTPEDIEESPAVLHPTPLPRSTPTDIKPAAPAAIPKKSKGSDTSLLTTSTIQPTLPVKEPAVPATGVTSGTSSSKSHAAERKLRHEIERYGQRHLEKEQGDAASTTTPSPEVEGDDLSLGDERTTSCFNLVLPGSKREKKVTLPPKPDDHREETAQPKKRLAVRSIGPKLKDPAPEVIPDPNGVITHEGDNRVVISVPSDLPAPPSTETIPPNSTVVVRPRSGLSRHLSGRIARLSQQFEGSSTFDPEPDIVQSEAHQRPHSSDGIMSSTGSTGFKLDATPTAASSHDLSTVWSSTTDQDRIHTSAAPSTELTGTGPMPDSVTERARPPRPRARSSDRKVKEPLLPDGVVNPSKTGLEQSELNHGMKPVRRHLRERKSPPDGASNAEVITVQIVAPPHDKVQKLPQDRATSPSVAANKTVGMKRPDQVRTNNKMQEFPPDGATNDLGSVSPTEPNEAEGQRWVNRMKHLDTSSQTAPEVQGQRQERKTKLDGATISSELDKNRLKRLVKPQVTKATVSQLETISYQTALESSNVGLQTALEAKSRRRERPTKNSRSEGNPKVNLKQSAMAALEADTVPTVPHVQIHTQDWKTNETSPDGADAAKRKPVQQQLSREDIEELELESVASPDGIKAAPRFSLTSARETNAPIVRPLPVHSKPMTPMADAVTPAKPDFTGAPKEVILEERLKPEPILPSGTDAKPLEPLNIRPYSSLTKMSSAMSKVKKPCVTDVVRLDVEYEGLHTGAALNALPDRVEIPKANVAKVTGTGQAEQPELFQVFLRRRSLKRSSGDVATNLDEEVTEIKETLEVKGQPVSSSDEGMQHPPELPNVKSVKAETKIVFEAVSPRVLHRPAAVTSEKQSVVSSEPGLTRSTEKRTVTGQSTKSTNVGDPGSVTSNDKRSGVTSKARPAIASQIKPTMMDNRLLTSSDPKLVNSANSQSANSEMTIMTSSDSKLLASRKRSVTSSDPKMVTLDNPKETSDVMPADSRITTNGESRYPTSKNMLLTSSAPNAVTNSRQQSSNLSDSRPLISGDSRSATSGGSKLLASGDSKSDSTSFGLRSVTSTDLKSMTLNDSRSVITSSLPIKEISHRGPDLMENGDVRKPGVKSSFPFQKNETMAEMQRSPSDHSNIVIFSNDETPKKVSSPNKEVTNRGTAGVPNLIVSTSTEGATSLPRKDSMPRKTSTSVESTDKRKVTNGNGATRPVNTIVIDDVIAITTTTATTFVASVTPGGPKMAQSQNRVRSHSMPVHPLQPPLLQGATREGTQSELTSPSVVEIVGKDGHVDGAPQWMKLAQKRREFRKQLTTVGLTSAQKTEPVIIENQPVTNAPANQSTMPPTTAVPKAVTSSDRRPPSVVEIVDKLSPDGSTPQWRKVVQQKHETHKQQAPSVLGTEPMIIEIKPEVPASSPTGSAAPPSIPTISATIATSRSSKVLDMVSTYQKLQVS